MKRLKARIGWFRQPPTTLEALQDMSVDCLRQSQLPFPQVGVTPISDNDSSLLFPDGVRVLYDCPDATVDICFIHGLTGDREGTWTAPGQSSSWPETLLPRQLSKARILTYGYDAYIVRRTPISKNRLINHSLNLLTDLTTNREWSNASSRPLIFVAHSLGGLVCKKAVVLSRNNAEHHLRSIFDCTKGFAFLGTPHRGAWMAQWAKIPAKSIGLLKSTSKSLLDILSTDNELLESIQRDFWGLIREQREGGMLLEVTCFFEELPLPVVGPVVAQESATIEGYTGISIHANHRDMVRFASPEDNGYKRLVGELARWQAEAAQVPPQAMSEAATKCLQSLAFPQMQDRFHDIDYALPGTCQWLLRHKTYVDWVDSHRELLWIKGKPGSGKSTLLKYVLRRCEECNAAESDLVLSFFFHGRGKQLQRTTLGFFRSLLHQVLEQVPDMLTNIVTKFEQRCEVRGKPHIEWQWHSKELYDFFKSCLPKILAKRTVWLFVDALDECGKDNAVELVGLFKSLLKGLPSKGSQFHICFTCRHYPVLDPYCKFEICLEDENEKDIATYVDSQLAAFDTQTKPAILDLITGRASGIFMWARLVVARVLDLDREGVGLKKIETAIKSILPDLNTLYLELLGGMGPASLKLLQWLCCATRPLTPNELQWAMAVEANCSHQSLEECLSTEEYISGTGSMKRQVQTLSCGLAQIVSTEKGEVVQFIHQSVKDFCLEKGLLALDSSLISPDNAIGLTQLRLSRICARYLEMERTDYAMHTSLAARDVEDIDYPRYTHFRAVELKSKSPFLDYATTSWTTHLREADGKHIHEREFLKDTWLSDEFMKRWRCFYLALRGESCPVSEIRLLHVLSKFQTTGLLKVILERNGLCKDDVNSIDGNSRTPLSISAEHGNTAVVQLLLETRMADLNSKDKNNHTPLSFAAMNGHEEIIRLLIGADDHHEIDINSRNTIGGQTPLSLAAMNGHAGVVRLLLSTNRAETNSIDYGNRTPLLWAVRNNRENVVRLLVETGCVDVNAKDEAGATPLSWAARRDNDNVTIVELLIATGKVDVNVKDNFGLTPLSWASAHGCEKTVSLLLATDKVDIYSRDNYDRTPFSWAGIGNHKGVLQLLQAKRVWAVGFLVLHTPLRLLN